MEKAAQHTYFYPRPPRGGRQFEDETGEFTNSISIHALREEGDTDAVVQRTGLVHFYPRPPRGGRPGIIVDTGEIMRISIHALREEGD